MDLGRWDFRQRPSGLFRRVLHLPDLVLRHGLGFLFGERLLLLTHVGRVSGVPRYTTLEVAEHDRLSGEFLVVSGTGPGADWYRNVRAHPAASITVGRRTWVPEQRFPSAAEAGLRFGRYERRHPRAARRLLALMGQSYDGSDSARERMMEQLPMVAFSDTGSTAAPSLT